MHRVLDLAYYKKKLDMRWRKTQSLLTDLPPLQLEILEKAAEMVKVDGYLVYSTCTINSGENEDVLEKFLATHKNFIIDPVSFEGVATSCRGYDYNISATRSDGWILYGSCKTHIIIIEMEYHDRIIG